MMGQESGFIDAQTNDAIMGYHPLVYAEFTESNEEYQSGEFYKRELPCILSLLGKIAANSVQIWIGRTPLQ